MKKVLFWALTPLTMPLLIAFMTIEGVSSWCVERFHLWEKWCYGTPEGMKYIGGGWYKGVDK